MPAERCVAHPARPAVDRCPTCGRPRCGADALGLQCEICAHPAVGTPPAPALERLVRGALGASAMALLGGVVLQEYVGAPYFAYLAPAITGVAVASAATAASGEPQGPVLQRVRLAAVLYAVLAAGLGFALDRTYGVFTARVDVVGPYLVGGAAAWLWSAPPRRRVRASADE
jgi:hypothetical protein